MVMDPPLEKQLKSVPVSMRETGSFDDPLENRRVLSQSDGAMLGSDPVDRGTVLTQSVMLATPTRVMIKHGDTLWSLAQQYRISVHQLMAVNGLSTDYIQAGQSLRLPESVVDGTGYEER